MPVLSGLRGFSLSLLLYVCIALGVFLAQGGEPPLNVDHIAYFKSADQVISGHPQGDYWRSIDSTHTYPVLMAYAFKYTHSHILTLKFFLLVISVFYYLSFELFMGLLTTSKWKAMMFALLSGMFVSMGASFWGVTDFSASLNRSIVVPIFMLLLWGYFKFYGQWCRYLVFPVLVVTSILHLSAYYLIGILGALELWDFFWLRKARIDRQVAYFLICFLAAVMCRVVLNSLHLDLSSHVEHAVQAAVQATQATQVAQSSALELAAAAWNVELFAFPWRNMPLPASTLLLILLSAGLMMVLTIAGIRLRFMQGMNRLDQLMLGFLASIFVVAFGLQTTLWILRQWLPVFPVNFEEVRAMTFVMIPAIYFIYRLFEASLNLAPRAKGLACAALLVAAVLIQPVKLIKILPMEFREGVMKVAVQRGLLNEGDALRMMYARQLLGIEDTKRRFYYDAQGVIAWLKKNAGASQVIASDLNELAVLDNRIIGSFNDMLNYQVGTKEREAWKHSVEELSSVLATGDTQRAKDWAQASGASFVVLPWHVDEAVYSDHFYSIVAIR